MGESIDAAPVGVPSAKRKKLPSHKKQKKKKHHRGILVLGHNHSLLQDLVRFLQSLDPVKKKAFYTLPNSVDGSTYCPLQPMTRRTSFPGEKVSASSLHIPRMARILQNRLRPNAFGPTSLGFTSFF